ncbi:MAG: NUDIX domain-containing protein [Propionibacteriaceae bacterium]|nr:NUDIX domain-containing protein [Propionibacteriaceae bacterium]
MAHIHTGPGEHDLTVSAFIVKTTYGVPRLLLHRHKTLGIMIQPGGHVELTENPWQALAHELVEETGYNLSQLWVLQPDVTPPTMGDAVCHPQPMCVRTFSYDKTTNHYHIDLSWGFITAEEPQGLPGEGESQELVWVSAEELATMKDTYEDVRVTGLYLLNTLVNEWHPKWTGHWGLENPPTPGDFPDDQPDKVSRPS